jgi:hypothetical protein
MTGFYFDPNETSGSAYSGQFRDLLNETVVLLHTVDLLRTSSSGQLDSLIHRILRTLARKPC